MCVCVTASTPPLGFNISLYVRLSVCLSLCVLVYKPACLSVRLSVRPSVRPSVRLSVNLSVCLSDRPSVCLNFCLSTRVCVCLSPATDLSDMPTLERNSSWMRVASSKNTSRSTAHDCARCEGCVWCLLYVCSVFVVHLPYGGQREVITSRCFVSNLRPGFSNTFGTARRPPGATGPWWECVCVCLSEYVRLRVCVCLCLCLRVCHFTQSSHSSLSRTGGIYHARARAHTYTQGGELRIDRAIRPFVHK